MRWVRSLAPTLLLLSAGRLMVAHLAGLSPAAPAPFTTASAAGSELPWWTPIIVSLLLLAAAFLYWWRHRPRRPTVDPEAPDAAEVSGPIDGTVAPASEPPPPGDAGRPTPRFVELIRPVPSG